ncbi:hypothetical protein [Mesoflavibacter sp. CH_XMU1422-2]|uniref:hypothetical protein n=1 Tax=Mesoflavibacter sp. CH_XMU1422-2 TaxID=3107770 RepID=UPI0030093A16
MKYKILTIFCLVLVMFVKAQEKQNDATWEETISFIKDNVGFAVGSPNFYQEVINLKVSQGKYLIFEVVKSSDPDNHCNHEFTQKLDLDNLSKVELLDLDDYDAKRLKIKKRIYLTATRIETSVCGGNRNKTNMSLIFNSKEMTERMLKAFTHLAYLANNKRPKSKF